MKFLGYIHTHAGKATEHLARHFEARGESNPLLRPDPFTTIRARRGRGSIIDGPYVETKEQPGESGRGIS